MRPLRTYRRFYVRRLPYRSTRRPATANQQLALFEQMARQVIQLAVRMPIRGYTTGERRRLLLASRLLCRELRWLLLEAGVENGLVRTTKAASPEE